MALQTDTFIHQEFISLYICILYTETDLDSDGMMQWTETIQTLMLCVCFLAHMHRHRPYPPLVLWRMYSMKNPHFFSGLCVADISLILLCRRSHIYIHHLYVYFCMYFRDACIRGKEFQTPVFLKWLPRRKVTHVSSISQHIYIYTCSTYIH